MDDKFQMTLEESLFLAKKLLAESVFNNAKLEDVNTTFPETEAILDGVNVPGAKLDDIQVILNLRDAWRFLLSSVATEQIDLEFIKKINDNVSRNESLAWGQLRTGRVRIAGTNHRPEVPDEAGVESAVSKILKDEDKSITERALDLALYIMHSQLFWDGNKRTANLVANAVIVKHGRGIMSISPDNITEFNRLLQNYYDSGNGLGLKKFLYDRAIVDFSTKNVPVNVPVNIVEQEVLEIISQNPSATYDEIAEQVGKNRKTIARAVSRLKDKGAIYREGSDKVGSWVVR